MLVEAETFFLFGLTSFFYCRSHNESGSNPLPPIWKFFRLFAMCEILRWPRKLCPIVSRSADDCNHRLASIEMSHFVRNQKKRPDATILLSFSTTRTYLSDVHERAHGSIVSVGVDPTGKFWLRLAKFDVYNHCPECPYSRRHKWQGGLGKGRSPDPHGGHGNQANSRPRRCAKRANRSIGRYG